MTVVGLILFVSVFAMIVFRSVTKPKGEIEEMERLALENDNLVPKEEHK